MATPARSCTTSPSPPPPFVGLGPIHLARPCSARVTGATGGGSHIRCWPVDGGGGVSGTAGTRWSCSRQNCKELRRRYLPGWLPTDGNVALFDVGKVAVIRFRHRPNIQPVVSSQRGLTHRHDPYTQRLKPGDPPAHRRRRHPSRPRRRQPAGRLRPGRTTRRVGRGPPLPRPRRLRPLPPPAHHRHRYQQRRGGDLPAHRPGPSA
jgi:hypothetical protein